MLLADNTKSDRSMREGGDERRRERKKAQTKAQRGEEQPPTGGRPGPAAESHRPALRPGSGGMLITGSDPAGGFHLKDHMQLAP